MLSTTPLDGPFGVRIDGLDLRAPVADDVMRDVLRAFYDNQLIVISGQDLTPVEFERFARGFGTPHPHVLSHRRMPGLPGVMAISNLVDDDGTPVHGFNGAAFWHTDQSYEAEPSSATMLYAVAAPATGGRTLIANLHAAYDALDDAMKARLDGLTAIHLYGNRDEDAPGELPASALRDDAQRAAVPACRHPLVRRHPVTGRKALYAVAGTSRGIEGMAEPDALALLAELKAFATQVRFVTAHRYTVGDVAIWDTAATLHKAERIGPATGAHDTRFHYRVTVKGTPPLM